VTVPGYNPYAPPLAGKDDGAGPPSPDAPPTRTTEPAPGEALKWVYIGLASVSMAVAVARFLVNEELVRVIGSIGLINSFVAAAWIFQSWNGVPRRFRDGVSPAGAIGRFFIPIYQFYWLLAINLRLCRALDDALAPRTDMRAPRSLALLAPSTNIAAVGFSFAALLTSLRGEPRVLALVQIPFAAASHAAWFFYLFRCDQVRREVVQTVPRDETSASLWPAVLLFCLVGLFLLMFLAMRDFVSPYHLP
jgi:hypothetical protein